MKTLTLIRIIIAAVLFVAGIIILYNIARHLGVDIIGSLSKGIADFKRILSI